MSTILLIYYTDTGHSHGSFMILSLPSLLTELSDTLCPLNRNLIKVLNVCFADADVHVLMDLDHEIELNKTINSMNNIIVKPVKCEQPLTQEFVWDYNVDYLFFGYKHLIRFPSYLS